MLVLPQTVMIKWHNSYKKWFTEKGYPYTKNGEIFEVNVLDLLPKSGQKVKVICDYCKEIYFKTNNERKGLDDCCNNCRGKKSGKSKIKHTYDDILKEFQNRNYILLENEYKGHGIHHKYICENGHESSISIANLLRGKGCRECFKIKIGASKRFSLDEVRKIFEEGNCTLLSDKYVNSRQKLKYICSCGNIDEKDLSHFKRGQRCSSCGIIKQREANLKPNLTDEERENGRLIEGYKEWRNSVFMRDNYTCQACGDNGRGNLNVHHLNGYHWCVEMRTDIVNGVTLCEECHIIKENSFHKEMGKRGNTIYQFLNWFENYTVSKFNLNLLGESYETLFYFADEMMELKEMEVI